VYFFLILAILVELTAPQNYLSETLIL